MNQELQYFRGVYVWGTVGGGKTMLMDMFHDTLPGLNTDIRCRRVHYHDFMQVLTNHSSVLSIMTRI